LLNFACGKDNGCCKSKATVFGRTGPLIIMIIMITTEGFKIIKIIKISGPIPSKKIAISQQT
jgi:hypothetical protein